MLNEEQFRQICKFTQRHLRDSAASSEQAWLKDFPRAAEHRWYHTLCVLRNAERILVEERASRDTADVVRVAAILHAVSMFDCEHAIHGRVSAEIAERYLSEQNYPGEFVSRVARAIAEHGVDFDALSPDEMGAAFSWEGKVLIEADILDKLGASAVTGALLVLGQEQRLSFECHALLSKGRAMSRAVYFKDYFWTETGKRMAEDRFGFFLKFLEQLSDEVIAIPGPSQNAG
jgi:HD superfamily phosphodiesterase